MNFGTSNRTDLLCDPTGSRRFICIEAEHDIDCTGIEQSQIYAQLKEELLAGARHWFNKEEEHALQCHNMAYYHVNPIEDIVRNTYAPATLNESDCLSLSAAIIHQELKRDFPQHYEVVHLSNWLKFLPQQVSADSIRD